MTKRHTITALLAFLVVVAGLGGTVGYGVYYRTDLYRRRVAERLTGFFNLPTDIGRIRPYAFTSRELFDVQVWLPDRRDRIFQCERAVWDTAGAGGRGGTLVQIDDPVLSIGSEAWQREDYFKILRQSLAHNYRGMNIHEIRLNRAVILWPRRDFRLTVRGVDGSVKFDESGKGEGRLACRTLNGTTVSEPVQILASLDPQAEDFIPEVTLTVPTLPLQALGLDEVAGAPVTQGSFAGRITLRQESQGGQVLLSGSATNVKLEELTGRLPSGAVPGVLDLNIDEAVVCQRELDRLAFRGEVRNLKVGPLLAGFGLGDLGGEARLTVRDARLIDDRIEHLAFGGEWLGAAADPFVRRILGKGGINGRLFVRVHNLEVRDNELVQADADIRVLPPRNGPATIDRALLLELVKEKAGLSIPESLLPASIEFTQMSARLLVDGRRLRILSTGRGADAAVITAKIGGYEVPLLADMDESVDLGPAQDRLREQLRAWRVAARERIRARAATTRPGAGGN